MMRRTRRTGARVAARKGAAGGDNVAKATGEDGVAEKDVAAESDAEGVEANDGTKDGGEASDANRRAREAEGEASKSRHFSPVSRFRLVLRARRIRRASLFLF